MGERFGVTHGARRRRGGEPLSIGTSLDELSRRLGTNSTRLTRTVFGRWADLVGEAVAVHVQPLRIADGTLVVAVDHPAWATQIRQLAPEILRRIAQDSGEPDAPEHLEVRVRR